MTTTPVEQEARSSRGFGCWLTAIVTVFVTAVLVVIALFLPPFSIYDRLFGVQYAPLVTTGDSIATVDQGLRIVAASDSSDFGANLSALPLRSFENPSPESPEWIPAARAELPYYLALQSPVYGIDTQGDSPDATILSASLPPTNPDLVDMYGWYASASEWRFLPSQLSAGRREAVVADLPDRVGMFQAAPLTPTVMLAYDVTQMLTEDAASLATIVAPAGLQPRLDGTLTGSLAPGFNTNAGYLVMPSIRDYADPRAVDTTTVAAILGNSQLRSAHIRELMLLTASGGYDGLWIDYRGVPGDLREAYSQFIAELGANLHANGLLLGVAVPAAENLSGVWQTGPYDWRAMGQHVDYLQINLGLDPRTYAAGSTELVEAMMRWATGEVSRHKILLGLSARSVREIAGTYSPVGYDEALTGLGNVVIDASQRSETGSIEPGTEIRASLDGREALAGIETVVSAPYLDYLDGEGNTTARMWLTTGSALRYRMDRTIPFALAGVAFDDLLSSDLADDVYTAILDYKTQLPGVPAPAELALRWRIESADGLVDEVFTGVNEELVVTLAAPEGNYAFNVAVVGVGEQAPVESVRSGAAVALFRPTATPTPLPTATPTPLPTATPTPAPIVATAAPAANGGGGGAPATNFGANRPGAGSIQVGTFEYGGHVTNAASERAVSAMRRAGMTWLKIQKRFSPGAGLDEISASIGAARANGFKILIGTVGNPTELANGGDAYINEYVNWLAGIAGLGADAIEVWNEPNLDREWPRGQISGVAYTDMLRRAYQAIKSRNGSTIVISGAPAPTGAEAAFPGQVMNDDRFLREMRDAGALAYMDCIGMHYNEGIVPPTQTSGDPRDNFYTRYYSSMLDLYWGTFGGQKPICITELGYLTPEGFPSLPAAFAWAQNVTVGQQAAWLAQAAALSSQSGRVRLMIVWNVDFTGYGADPQAGYAMLRPDGSCPACDALAGAR